MTQEVAIDEGRVLAAARTYARAYADWKTLYDDGYALVGMLDEEHPHFLLWEDQLHAALRRLDDARAGLLNAVEERDHG